MRADIVVDLAAGDSGKGKVTHHLLKSGEYTHCIRFNGANNAGHTIYHEGQKIVTHLIPAGVFFGVKSIIGPGCALNVKGFFEEIEYLYSHGIDCAKQIYISGNTHIITDAHIKEDSSDTKIGTTKKGVGPCFRDKYGRTGIQAKDVSELKDFIIDFHEEISKPNSNLLLEGAQGFYLDPIVGDYPYVTSSHCTVAGALINGIPHTAINKVYGACKAYDTYVGAKKFEPDDPIFSKIREAGQEYGATTGRPRQCNFLNITALQKAVWVNSVSHLIINKTDILKRLNLWKVLVKDQVIDLESEDRFISYIQDMFKTVPHILFSYSPHEI